MKKLKKQTINMKLKRVKIDKERVYKVHWFDAVDRDGSLEEVTELGLTVNCTRCSIIAEGICPRSKLDIVLLLTESNDEIKNSQDFVVIPKVLIYKIEECKIKSRSRR